MRGISLVKRVALLMGFFAMTFAAGAVEVIYQDNFGGLPADALNGMAPDSRPDSEIWAAAAFFKGDGSYSVSGGKTANAAAILPVQIEPGGTYMLSVDVNVTAWNNRGNWVGLAFWNHVGSTGNAPTVTGNSPAALGLNAAGGLKAYHTGANLVGQGTGYGVVQTLRIKLITYADATPWEAEYYAGDTQLWSHEFSSNPTVTRVVIGTGGTGTELSGTFGNFSLAVIRAAKSSRAHDQVAGGDVGSGKGELSFERLGVPLNRLPARIKQLAKDDQGRVLAWGTMESSARKEIFAVCTATGDSIRIDCTSYKPSHVVLHVTPKGVPYVFAGKQFFKYDFQRKELVSLGEPFSMADYLLGYAVGPDGKIYVGLHPETRLVCVDPATDRVNDFGRIAEEGRQQYLLNLSVSDENVAYCPIGMVTPELWAVHLDTGERKQLLTAEIQEQMDAAHQKMAGVWLEKDGEVYALLGERVALCKPDGLQFPLDPPGRKSSTTSSRYVGHPLRLDKVFVNPLIREGILTVTDVATREKRELQTKVDGPEVSIYSIGCEWKGKLYGGGLKPAHTFEVDLQSGRMRDLGRLGQGLTQVYDLIVGRELLYQSSYTLGSITAFDPDCLKTEPPREIITLAHTHGQERAPEFVSGPDGRIYTGTLPVKGELGGALVRINPADHAVDVWRNVVPNQSIPHVESVPQTGEIFGVTAIRGGTSAEPVESEAMVFLWDCERERIVWTGTPVPGTTYYGKAVRRKDGLIVGVTRSDPVMVYFFDPKARETVHVAELPFDRLWYRELADRPGPDGRVFGLRQGGIFAIDPDDDSVRIIAEHPSLESLHSDLYLTEEGVLYYGHHGELWRVNLYPGGS